MRGFAEPVSYLMEGHGPELALLSPGKRAVTISTAAPPSGVLPTLHVPAPKDESTTCPVPDVGQWQTWLNPLPADPAVAHNA